MKKCLFNIEAMLGIPFDYDNWFEEMEVELTDEQFNQYCDTLVKWEATDEWNEWDDENGHDYFIRRDLPEIYKIVRQKLIEVVPIKWGEQCMEYIDQINIYTPAEIYSAVEDRDS